MTDKGFQQLFDDAKQRPEFWKTKCELLEGELGRLRAERDDWKQLSKDWEENSRSRKTREKLMKQELETLRDWQRRALPLIKCWLALSYCDGYFLQDETEMKKVREGYEELIAEAGQTEKDD